MINNNVRNKLIHFKKQDYLSFIKDKNDRQLENSFPKKSYLYLFNKYFCHPFYNYHVYGIQNIDGIFTFLVLRICSHESKNALRIVDFYGPVENFKSIFQCLQELLEYFDAEYLDFYNFGLSENLLLDTGFIKVDSNNEISLPNYFEPFDENSVNLIYAYKADKKLDFLICKADSDQDRPNIIT